MHTDASVRDPPPDVLLDAGPHEAEMLGHHALDPVGAADRLDEEHQQRARP
ncbi:hypothetical protein ABZ016_38440 [Streptomyces sp. NPDC006372]|uniref:hypothetical protein n=1 Tax=Streptomyces sp. NPDC006372 TaxID=3155599 RepID=UPI0033A14C57